MSLENVFYNKLSEKNGTSKYDCLVLFSGGKDSTYLAHLIKQVKGQRVCLFTVDNSFEDDTQAKKVADQLNLDLFIYKPKVRDILKFYNFLLTDPAIIDLDDNPLCYLCNRYFTSLGMHFADNMGIPFVASGTTAAQIFGTKAQMSERMINIAEEMLKARFDNAYEAIKATQRYKTDSVVKDIVDKMFICPESVSVIHPFLYFGYNISQIKKELQEEYQWENPTPGVSNAEYTTSGCKLTSLFGIFKEKLGFKFHELNEFKLDYENGSLTKEEFEHATSYFKDMISKELNCEMKCIVEKLGLNGQLL